jgi:DNA polymerase-3 subunit epsilon
MSTLAVQQSFDDLGTPLHDVTFCVVDLETTGGSPATCGITEVGAMKVRGGECLGTFQTLVNPGCPIPPEIVVLTGITDAMVVPAPRIESVLPSLEEFIGDAVIVGHNIRFDLAFLRAAHIRADRPVLANRSVDTAALARRLVRDEVPNCKLSTLASRLRLDHLPSHRALDDVIATVDLLHLLLERAGRLGVTGLDDLLALPTMGGHEQAAKLKLTATLPRTPGVYLFRDAQGRVLYVGKASNLRARVRSYFSSDPRRKVARLLREAHHIDHEPLATPLHAAVREVRLIHQHQPRYNTQAKTWKKYVYLKLTCNEPFPRLSIVRTTREDGGLYLGPLSSAAAARRVADAIESVIPLRRCTARPATAARSGPCAPAQLGVATCPCAGEVSAGEYAAIVQRAIAAMTTDPALVLDPLADRMRALAAEQRFEEAADVRDRANAFAEALLRQRRMQLVRAADLVDLRTPDGTLVRLRSGALIDVAPSDALPAAPPSLLDDLPGPPIPRHLADELLCIARYLDQHAGSLQLIACSDGLADPVARPTELRPKAR